MRPPVRLQVAAECGEQFLAALRARGAGRPVEIGPVDGSPTDAVVVGGVDVDTDLTAALAAGARWVQTLTSGVDKVAGARFAGRDVALTNAPNANARPVSEFAIARILEHAKQLPAFAAQQRAREWQPRWLDSPAGATCTVVGLGAIGTRVARLATAFEMHVIGIRRDPAKGGEFCEEVLGADALGAALARSDYCVLAPALTADTKGMLSAEVLAQARAGLFIVNVGRGELVDHDALLAAVREGRVTAALDVAPVEPPPPDSPMWDTDGIVLSPHTAALTPRLIDGLVDIVVANLDDFAAGRSFAHQLDPVTGYPIVAG
jgi:phosphoglycerate dehydrogenase-like enzyme